MALKIWIGVQLNLKTKKSKLENADFLAGLAAYLRGERTDF